MADWKKLLDDAVSTIGDGVQRAGEGLRELADDARKVAGLGRGSLEIALDRSRYGLGETVQGAVKLMLAEPVAARRLVVAVRARRRRGRTRDGAQEDEVVFEFESTVAGEQVFQSGEHRFAIDLPRELEVSIDAQGLLGEALRAAKMVRDMTRGQLRWTVEARLDIAWKRDLSTRVEIAVLEGAPTPNPNPTPTPEPAFASIPPAEFLGALDSTLAELRRRGRVVIHEHRAPPVEPAIVMQALAQHPDLDAELLHFYGVTDGIEIAVAEPRVVAEHYDTIDATRTVAARWGGTIESLDEIDNDRDIAPPLFREFCDDTLRVLVIPPLLRLLDDSEDFAHRDGRNVVFGRILLRYGDYFGLVHADVIRSWREPPRGEPGRPGYFDDCADAWQACLAAREKIHPARWWIVRGDDHGAGLRDPKLLRWSEMLAFCLAHLEG